MSAWRDGAARLRAAGVESAEADARVLLAHVMGLDLSRLLLAGEPDHDQREAYDVLLTRRARREPLQHLTGTAPFRRVMLQVGPGVFVPRPETEVLAGWAIERATAITSGISPGITDRAPVVVDLGTGSGAIALAVADEVPGARVHAVELDERAHGWAARNLAGSGVDLRSGDLAEAFTDLDGTVDVVVSNPPYIPLTAWESVAPEARDHDPAAALWSGEDGLDAIRAVVARAARLLRPGGDLGFEHAEVQADSAPGVLVSDGRWERVRDRRDLAGRPRCTTARLAR